jgi:hypothetical protein
MSVPPAAARRPPALRAAKDREAMTGALFASMAMPPGVSAPRRTAEALGESVPRAEASAASPAWGMDEPKDSRLGRSRQAFVTADAFASTKSWSRFYAPSRKITESDPVEQGILQSGGQEVIKRLHHDSVGHVKLLGPQFLALSVEFDVDLWV